MSEIVIIGLGPGSPDAISLGAFNAIRDLLGSGTPVYARTLIHPTVDWLKSEHQLEFTGSFDSLYETAESFDTVYDGIVGKLIDLAKSHNRVGYAVPGHPSFGETAVERLRQRAPSEGISIRIIGSQSYLDSVVESETHVGSNLRIIDALDIITPTQPFQPEHELLSPNALHVICQVYDKAIASELKLALLEIYPPEAKVVVITAAGIPGQTKRLERSLAELDHSGIEFNHLTSVIVYPLPDPERFVGYEGLLTIMARLRNPDGGCPWDIEQTPLTLRKYMIEEAYELVDVLDSNFADHTDDYAEELGDVLLQIVFHAQIARENALFTMRDIVRALTEKLLRRHPHVFADTIAETSGEVLKNWNAIKQTEKTAETRESILDGVPRSMPSLLRALEISKRAAKAGFEWDSIEGVFDKLTEEVVELRVAIETGHFESVESELGDLLFTVVNLARFQKVEPELALSRMVGRFSHRFRHIERHAKQLGKTVDQLTQSEMEEVWQAAKKETVGVNSQ